MKYIPSDRPELLRSALPPDRIIQFIKPIRQLPPSWDEDFRFFIKRLTANTGMIIPFPTETGTVYAKKIGAGIEGRHNLNAMLKDSGVKIERSEPYYAVKFFEVVEVVR